MRRSVLLLLGVVLLAAAARAGDPAVHFRISKPYCLLNFLQTCDGQRSASRGLVDAIERAGLLQDSGFRPVLAAWRAIPLEYTYPREQYPEHRARSRYGRTVDGLVLAAVQSDDLPGFRARAIGQLPNADLLALFRVLETAEPYYDRLVWQAGRAELGAALDTLRQYEPRISRLFGQLNRFYGGAWPDDIPFTVALYPVPGRRPGTAATPYGPALCVGVGAGDTDYDGMAGVVLHEMCHSVYNEQPAAVQAAQERYFLGSPSRYSAFAYRFFDEGMATACGNGWAREQLNGQADTGAWYANTYINGFGHGLYPLVQTYLAGGRALDSAFVRAAIHRFSGLYPRAPYEYGLLFAGINLYSDAATADERAALKATLNRHFRVASWSASSPLLAPESLDELQHSDGTQLIVLPDTAAAALARLKSVFPPLASALRGKKDAAWIVRFFDADRRPVVVLRVRGTEGLDRALAALERERYLDEGKAYLAL